MARLIRSGEGVVAIIIAGFESLSRPRPGLSGCSAPSRPLRLLLPKRRVVGLPTAPAGSAAPLPVTTGALPTGALPTGALPTGALPTGALPTGALPTGSLASGAFWAKGHGLRVAT